LHAPIRRKKDRLAEFNQIKFVCRQLYFETASVELKHNDLEILKTTARDKSQDDQLHKTVDMIGKSKKHWLDGITITVSDTSRTDTDYVHGDSIIQHPSSSRASWHSARLTCSSLSSVAPSTSPQASLRKIGGPITGSCSEALLTIDSVETTIFQLSTALIRASRPRSLKTLLSRPRFMSRCRI
jgi:hypothetical protein